MFDFKNPASLYELFTGKSAQGASPDMIMGGGFQPPAPSDGMYAPGSYDRLLGSTPPGRPDAPKPQPQQSPYRNLPGMPGSMENINAMANAGPSMKGGASGGMSGGGGIMKMFGG